MTPEVVLPVVTRYGRIVFSPYQKKKIKVSRANIGKRKPQDQAM